MMRFSVGCTIFNLLLAVDQGNPVDQFLYGI